MAKAFHFEDEIQLLSAHLSTRLSEGLIGENKTAWTQSMAYSALADIFAYQELREETLADTLRQLSSESSDLGWEDLATILNLLGAFYWEGDLLVEGRANLEIKGEAVASIDFNKRLSVAVDVDTEGSLDLEGFDYRLEMENVTQPITVLFFARGKDGRKNLEPYPIISERFTRVYSEETLLSGPRRLSEDLNVHEEPLLKTGDLLQTELTFTIEEAIPIAEFYVQIPGGAILNPAEIEYRIDGKSVHLDGGAVAMRVVDQPKNALEAVFQVYPLEAGEHTLTLPYQIQWAGRYLSPMHKVVFPKSGRVYALGEPYTLVVEP